MIVMMHDKPVKMPAVIGIPYVVIRFIVHAVVYGGLAFIGLKILKYALQLV